MKGDFSDGPARPGNTELRFPMAGLGYKKIRRLVLHVREGRQKKDEVFKRTR